MGIITMNKSELVERMATGADISKAKANLALDAFTAAVTDALKAGDQVSLIGFGTFKTSQRAARTGRNPQTGETINIKAATVPSFKAGSQLKEAGN